MRPTKLLSKIMQRVDKHVHACSPALLTCSVPAMTEDADHRSGRLVPALAQKCA